VGTSIRKELAIMWLVALAATQKSAARFFEKNEKAKRID